MHQRSEDDWWRQQTELVTDWLCWGVACGRQSFNKPSVMKHPSRACVHTQDSLNVLATTTAGSIISNLVHTLIRASISVRVTNCRSECGKLSRFTRLFSSNHDDDIAFFTRTRAVQPVATCRQSPYLHKSAIVIVTSFSLWCYSLQSWPRPPLWTPYRV